MNHAQAEKYYVVPRGKRFAFTAMVHREGCPLLPRINNARVWNHSPFDDDKYNHYQRCQKCWKRLNHERYQSWRRRTTQ